MKGTALVVIALAGCNLNLNINAGIDAPAVGSGELQWMGTVVDQTIQPITNATPTVCVPGHPEIACVQANATGAWTLTLRDPGTEETVPVLGSAMGYASELELGLIDAPATYPGTTFTKSPREFVLPTDDARQAQLAPCGFSYPDQTNGFVFLAVHTPAGTGAAGATVTIQPAGTPVYAGSGGAFDPALAATSDAGQVIIGNVPPGPVQITVTMPAMTCDLGGSDGLQTDGDWPSTGSETLDAYVVANAMTDGLSAICH